MTTRRRPPLTTESPEARRSYQRVGPEAGFVKVTYAGGIAQVRVDGRTYGFTPQVIRVEPGQRFISLIGNAYTPSQFVLDVQSGDTAHAAFKVPATAHTDSTARPAAPAVVPPAASSPPPAGAAPITASPAGAPQRARPPARPASRHRPPRQPAPSA